MTSPSNIQFESIGRYSAASSSSSASSTPITHHRRKRYLPEIPAYAHSNEHLPRSYHWQRYNSMGNPSSCEEPIEPFRSRVQTMPSRLQFSPRLSANVGRQRSLSACLRSPNDGLALVSCQESNDSLGGKEEKKMSDSLFPSCSSSFNDETSSTTNSLSSSPSNFKELRVLVLGSDGVGKERVLQQIISICTGQSMGSRSGSALIDVGQEKRMVIFEVYESDLQSDDSESRDASMKRADGLLILYSITNRKSFELAGQILTLMLLNFGKLNPNLCALLVGNKVDLERAREVSTEEAKSLATRFEVKHLEVSAELTYNLEALVKALGKQLWLNQAFDSKGVATGSTLSLKSLFGNSFEKRKREKSLFGRRAKRVGGWLKKSLFTTHSCETLHSI